MPSSSNLRITVTLIVALQGSINKTAGLVRMPINQDKPLLVLFSTSAASGACTQHLGVYWGWGYPVVRVAQSLI